MKTKLKRIPRHMLKFIIKIYFIFSLGGLFAQQAANDSLKSVKKPFKLNKFNLRAGFDIGNFIYGKTQDLGRYNFYLDSNLYKDYYLIFHFGNEEYLFDNTLIEMSTSGSYAMLGIDYNLYDNWPGMDNQIMLGFSVGKASFSNTLQKYRINQSSDVFPSETIISNKEFDNLSATWMEIRSAIQVELFKNIYVGYNISLKYLLSDKKYPDFELTYIPGFRRVNSNSSYGFGLQYFISYRFKSR